MPSRAYVATRHVTANPRWHVLEHPTGTTGPHRLSMVTERLVDTGPSSGVRVVALATLALRLSVQPLTLEHTKPLSRLEIVAALTPSGTVRGQCRG